MRLISMSSKQYIATGGTSRILGQDEHVKTHVVQCAVFSVVLPYPSRSTMSMGLMKFETCKTEVVSRLKELYLIMKLVVLQC